MKNLSNSPAVLLFLLCAVLIAQGIALWYLVWGIQAQDQEAEMLSSCLQKERYERIACLRPYVALQTKTTSPTLALQEVLRMTEEGVIDDCHVLAHEIGKTNLNEVGDPARAFSTCPSGCVEGCYHGVMEAYAQQKSPDAVIEEAPLLCAELGSNPLLYRQCLHGIGHGLFTYAHGDIEAALALCALMPDAFSQSVCQGGAYMENINQYMTLTQNELQIVLPTLCAGLADPSICAYAVGEGLMFYTGHTVAEALVLCTALPSSLYTSCEKGVYEEEDLAERTKNTH